MPRIPKDRQGRGRLSRLDKLPEQAQPHLVWLNGQLRANRRDQVELRDEFNARLRELGIEPISNGSFSRYSVRKAVEFRKVDQSLRLSRDMKEMLGVTGADDLTIHLSNKLQILALEVTEAEASELSARDVMELSRALQAVVSALKQSADYRRLLEDEHKRKLAETLDTVEEAAAKEPMDGAAVLAMIRKAYGWIT